MARLFAAASSQRIVVADAASNQVSGTSATWSVWIKATTINAERRLIHRGDVYTGEVNYEIMLWDNYAGGNHNYVDFRFENGYSYDFVASTTRITAGTWYHVCVVKSGTGAGALKLYLNGVLEGNATSNLSLTARTFPLVIGAAKNDASYTQYADATIAEFAMWEGWAATAGDALALAKGASPSAVRRGSGEIYFPLLGSNSPETDLWSGTTGTVTGATKADHPPVAYASAPLTVTKTTASASYVDMASADTLTFTNTADMAITAALASADTLTFTNTAALAITAELAAATTLTFSSSGSMGGYVDMAADTTLTFTNTAALAAKIPLAAATTLTFTTTAALSNAVDAVSWNVYVDWNNDGDFSDANEDITAYVMDMKWNVGFRRAFQEVADEMRCTLTLYNSAKRFSPENASSPLYGQLVPYRQIKITSTRGATTRTMWRGWIDTISPTPFERGEQRTVIGGIGAKRFLQDSEIHLELMENVTADEVITRALELVQLPVGSGTVWLAGLAGASEIGTTTYIGSVASRASLEAGIEEFPFVGDNWADGVSAYDVIAAACGGERGRFYFDRDGKAVFWNRNHLQVDYTVDATITDTMQQLTYEYANSIANDINVTVYPRAISADNNEILWQQERSTRIKAGETKTIRARFAGAAGERVGGRLVQFPSGSDFVYTASSMSLSMVSTAQAAEISITNTGSDDAEITTLIVRGQKLTTYNRQDVTDVDGASIATYGRRELRIDTRLLDNVDVARNIAAYELERRKSPRGEVTNVTLMNRDTATVGLMLERTVGDHIALVETQTAHNDDYIIVGEEHTLRDGMKNYRVVWQLEPASSTRFWLVGVTGLSEIGTTTTLGL